MKRDVGAELDVQITALTTLEFQIAVAPHPGAEVTESLSFELDGKTIDPDVREIAGEHGNRIHMLDAPVGNLKVTYAATVLGQADPAPVGDLDYSTYLRPSRYAEADKFFGFGGTEFGDVADSVSVLEKISSWVGTRLSYVPGSSDPIDGAADTLLAGSGVCRDYAHLVIALLRSVNVPARLVSVYAPGCQPMDFHAVAEALVAALRAQAEQAAQMAGAEVGQAGELFERPLHPYTQGLIETLPGTGPRLPRLPAIAGQVPDLGALPRGCRFSDRCPLADDECGASEPTLAAAGERRRVACWKAAP